MGVALGKLALAFCGFFVSGASGDLYNNATQVALMRDGNRTVISMANNYQGPPEDFALVVPVPVVLQKENVRTLPKDLFDRLDQLAAPRLVEYWEQDPCLERDDDDDGFFLMRSKSEDAPAVAGGQSPVRVEAEFVVGEYEVVILSADDASALDTWLRDNGYKIPAGAEPYLRPYVQSGSKFFVAKVNVKKVAMKDGMAMLSPLRFHYDADTFSLPIRLGLLNAKDAQDLIIHILARNDRYDVANYPNATIPTNLEVSNEVRERFGEFYAAVFDKVLEKNPNAVVTEYAWGAGSCDPCPIPPLGEGDLTMLGLDVIPSAQSPDNRQLVQYDFVLTRLHARYTRDTAGEDLVFRRAGHIVGGRESRKQGGALETGATPVSYTSSFQGRYVIRHSWQGEVKCTSPQYGVWGARTEPGGGINVARDLAFAPRGQLSLAGLIAGEVPEIDLQGTYQPPPSAQPPWYARWYVVWSLATLLAALAVGGAVYMVRREKRVA